MELALQKRPQEVDQEGFNCDAFPLTTMLEFEEVNEQLKQPGVRKSLVNTFNKLFVFSREAYVLLFQTEKLKAIGGKVLVVLSGKFW